MFVIVAKILAYKRLLFVERLLKNKTKFNDKSVKVGRMILKPVKNIFRSL